MASKERQQLIKKVAAWVQEKFGGSGEPEIDDAAVVFDYCENIFGKQDPVFQKLLQDVCTRTHSLDTSWARNPGTHMVPELPEEGETMALVVDHGYWAFEPLMLSRANPR